jgi:hypothetical protein
MSLDDRLKREIINHELGQLEVEEYRLQIRHRAAKKVEDHDRLARIVEALEKIESEKDVLNEELEKLNIPGETDVK